MSANEKILDPDHESVYNADVMWTDEAKPIVPERTVHFHYAEVNPQPVMGAIARGQFPWRTPEPEHEHFSVLISYRDDSIVQDLRLERIHNKWAIATRVVSGSPGRRLLLECKDTEFPDGLGYDGSLPGCWPGFPTRQ